MRLLNKLKYFLLLVIVILLGLWLIKPLTIPGFYPMHDDTQVTRVFEMAQSLHDGLFPVRWVNDLGYGYGYPIFNFYAPLAYYIGGFMMFFHVSALIATKVMIGIGFVLAGVSMYLLAKSFWGEAGGLFAAVCFLLAPYHALDMYVRGDIAELYAYAFVPLAFYGIWNAYKTLKWRYVLFGAIGFAGIILSHNLTALMVTPFLVITAALLVVLPTSGWKRIYPLLILLIGLLLAGFYWIPVFPEMTYTNVLSQVGGGADFHNHFVCLSQLWNSTWGFGGSTAGCVDGISFALGKFYIGIVVLSLVALPFFFHKKRQMGWIVLFSLLFLTVSLFLLLPYSVGIWNSIHALAFLQYPWRFLLTASFFMSFLGGSIIWLVRQYFKKPIFVWGITIALCVVVFFAEYRYFVPQYNYPTTGSEFTQKDAMTWKISQISDEYMPKNFQKPIVQQEVPQQLVASFSGMVTVLSNNTKEKRLQLHTVQPQAIYINLAYFPGWQATLDGHKSLVFPTSKGMQITIPEGDHILNLSFHQTTVELIGDFVSFAGIFLSIVGIIVFAL